MILLLWHVQSEHIHEDRKQASGYQELEGGEIEKGLLMFWNYVSVMVVQHYEHSKSHSVIQLQGVNVLRVL